MTEDLHTDAARLLVPPQTSGSVLRGAARLAFEGVLGVTGIVETIHGNIARWNPCPPRAPVQTRGIAWLVYRSVRGVTHVTRAGVDAALALFEPLLERGQSTPAREAARSALNGVLGDHLVKTSNPLAIPMRLRRHGSPLQLDKSSLAETISAPGSRVAILVHGLCMNDLQWLRAAHDHGAALARDLGYTALYLHYNSGRHISENGRAFAGLLETLANAWPAPLEEIVIIGHSMGGLVARSACHYAAQAKHRWLRHLGKLVFLGSPHHGAPMERAGNWLHLALGSNRYTTAFTQLARVRSAGITDLRYGNLLDEDWAEKDRFKHTGDVRLPVSLPEGVQCYAIAGATTAEESKLRDHFWGDGLVPVRSALGEHKDPACALRIPKSRQWIGRDMNHFDLLNRADVYERMRTWLDQETSPAAAQISNSTVG